jgi:hypothetical protein
VKHAAAVVRSGIWATKVDLRMEVPAPPRVVTQKRHVLILFMNPLQKLSETGTALLSANRLLHSSWVAQITAEQRRAVRDSKAR